MKKIFTLLFFITFFCPFLFAEIEYSLPDENLLKETNIELNQILREENGFLYTKDPSTFANYMSVLRVRFVRNSLIKTNDKEEEFNSGTDCRAVILDPSWLLVSGHCFLDKNIKKSSLKGLNDIEEIKNMYHSDFLVKLNNLKNEQVKAVPYKLSNLYLLQMVNQDGSEYKLENPIIAKLLITKATNATNLIKTLNKGHLMINRTVWNTPGSVHQVDFLRYTFYPYATNHELHRRQIEGMSVNNKTHIKTITLDGIVKHRAGDPLFYIEHGKEYLMGFGNALNIPDSPYQVDLRRTHDITLFSSSDKDEIINTIKNIDSVAAKRISQNILIK